MSEVTGVDNAEAGDATKETTLTECLRPLLTSMKLFGMYFGCRANVGDKSATTKSRVQWNVYLIYALVVVILLSINAFRMFSVFTEKTSY